MRFESISELDSLPRDAYATVIRGMQAAAVIGTARGLAKVAGDLETHGLKLYAKTGTPARMESIYRRGRLIREGVGRGMVVCGVARQPAGSESEFTDGLVFVFYIEGKTIQGSADAVQLAAQALPRALVALGWLPAYSERISQVQ
jgi:hypothetical protein